MVASRSHKATALTCFLSGTGSLQAPNSKDPRLLEMVLFMLRRGSFMHDVRMITRSNSALSSTITQPACCERLLLARPQAERARPQTAALCDAKRGEVLSKGCAADSLSTPAEEGRIRVQAAFRIRHSGSPSSGRIGKRGGGDALGAAARVLGCCRLAEHRRGVWQNALNCRVTQQKGLRWAANPHDLLQGLLYCPSRGAGHCPGNQMRYTGPCT